MYLQKVKSKTIIFVGILLRWEQDPDLKLSVRIQGYGLGLATELCFEKIPQNRLGMVFVIPRKKVLIPRHSGVYGRVSSEAQNYMIKLVLKKILLQQTELRTCFRVWVCEMLRKGIPRVCFYFCSTKRNSELFSLLQNGSKRNIENLLLFMFHSTEFWAFL
jgi:hypothetical protein